MLGNAVSVLASDGLLETSSPGMQVLTGLCVVIAGLVSFMVSRLFDDEWVYNILRIAGFILLLGGLGALYTGLFGT